MLLQTELFSNVMAEVDVQSRARTQAWMRTVQLIILQVVTAANQCNALCAVQQCASCCKSFALALCTSVLTGYVHVGANMR